MWQNAGNDPPFYFLSECKRKQTPSILQLGYNLERPEPRPQKHPRNHSVDEDVRCARRRLGARRDRHARCGLRCGRCLLGLWYAGVWYKCGGLRMERMGELRRALCLGLQR
jgi:hypothetical protein